MPLRMEAIPPTLPFALARAYGVQPTVRVRPIAPVSAAEAAVAPSKVETRISRLVAGAVPGGVRFDGETPTPVADAVPFYRHPADKNAAATSVNLGRVLDTSG